MVLGAPPLPETTPGGREQQFSGFKMGKPYRLSRSDLLDGRQSDWDLALKFLNTWLWHADTKTAAEFGNDPPEVLLMMSHAKIRSHLFGAARSLVSGLRRGLPVSGVRLLKASECWV